MRHLTQDRRHICHIPDSAPGEHTLLEAGCVSRLGPQLAASSTTALSIRKFRDASGIAPQTGSGDWLSLGGNWLWKLLLVSPSPVSEATMLLVSLVSPRWTLLQPTWKPNRNFPHSFSGTWSHPMATQGCSGDQLFCGYRDAVQL